MSILEMPCVLWSGGLGEYDIKCVLVEKPYGTSTLTVIENGKELERKVFIDEGKNSDAWREPFEVAELWRIRYYPRMIAAMRPIYQRYRPRG